MILNVLKGQDGLAGGHATHDGEPEGFRWAFLERQSPGSAGDQGDGAFPRRALRCSSAALATKTEAAGDIGRVGG